jgi:glycolate oxidase
MLSVRAECYKGSMTNIDKALAAIVGDKHVLTGEAITPEYTHDECLTMTAVTPLAVVLPANTDEVSRVLALANQHRVPVVARGAGTGLAGGATPVENGIVLSLERMKRILEIDTENQIAVCEPFVRLAELYAAAEERGLMYAIFPGENSATLGGNVATNAGGMQAVKYGVTRHHVLGLTVVLADGQVMRTGGKLAKLSSGYDLTQLIIGSEGTLAVVTEVIVKLVPRLPHRTTVLAPFKTLDEVTMAIPKLVATGLAPLMLEYIDMLTMATILARSKMDLGIDPKLREQALAYLLIVTEGREEDATLRDAQELGEKSLEFGAMDVYVLPSQAAKQLIEAREQSFWAAKAAGAGDVLDVVVPRSAIAKLVAGASAIGAEKQAFVVGCGHAGDGNVHMAVFHPEASVRSDVTKAVLKLGIELGGAVSGEHGIGRAKKSYYAAFEDPAKLALQKRIKQAFDPNGILNPHSIFD